MTHPGETVEAQRALSEELADIRDRLREAEETLAAIRDGEVDAVVVRGKGGQQVYALENADRPYRVLMEQMQDGAVTVSGDGSILYCNHRFAAIAGAPPERIIGTSIRGLFPDGPAAFPLSVLQSPSGVEASGEYVLRRADGSEVPVNLSVAKVQIDLDSEPIICAVVGDLRAAQRRTTELRTANDRLALEIDDRKKAETSLQLALDAAGMGSWDYDYATGTTFRSLRHDQLFGYAQLQPAWSIDHAIEHYLPEERARVRDAFQRARTSGRIEFEACIRRVDNGQIRRLHVNAQTFYADGKAARIAGVIADITGRREVEERLRQAQKIEAIGQLTGGVAHDFNNLLQVISSGLQILDRVKDPERRARIFKGMRQATDRGAGLSRQLLAFSRVQALTPVAVDLPRQLAGMQELLDRSLRGDVQVKFELPASLWPIEVDPGELELVILNLALNARDAMTGGGSITIRGVNVAGPDEDVAGDHVRLEIIDTGSGMPPEVLAHAFEPFFTTKEIGKGSGLGLAQAHGFAKASGGTVRIASEVGRGTTITLLLPRTHKLPLAEETAHASPAAADPSDAGQILLVEDDDEVAALTIELIQELGYQTTRVGTAEAALGALANARAIDLVFSDVMMPGAMNGVDLAVEIRRRRPTLPVVLTSGYAEAVRHECEKLQIDVIPKPFGMDDLREAFDAAIRAPRLRPRHTDPAGL